MNINNDDQTCVYSRIETNYDVQFNVQFTSPIKLKNLKLKIWQRYMYEGFTLQYRLKNR